jgi:hypothetical protein
MSFGPFAALRVTVCLCRVTALQAYPLTRLPAYPPTHPPYFNNPFAIVCSCMLLVPS